MSVADIVPVPEALIRAHARSERWRSLGSLVALSVSTVFSTFWFLVFLIAATPIAFLPLVALASSLLGVGAGASRAVRAHRVLGALGDGREVMAAEYAPRPGLLMLRLGDGRILSLITDDEGIARARRKAERRGLLPEARLVRSGRT